MSCTGTQNYCENYVSVNMCEKIGAIFLLKIAQRIKNIILETVHLSCPLESKKFRTNVSHLQHPGG